MRPFVRPLLALIGLAVGGTVSAQSTYTYQPFAASNAWLSSFNWSGGALGKHPGSTAAGGQASGNAGDLAVIGTFAFANGLGIDMGTAGALLTVGGIDFNSGSNDLQVGNSSATNGVLRLNGATVNGVANTLIAVRGSRNLTIADRPTVNGDAMMDLRLGITNGVFQVNTNRTLTISSNIVQANANSGFTVQGGGTVILSGASNGTNGTVTVSAGTLQIGNGGTTGDLGTGGSVTNNANLTFNRSNTHVMGITITGNGSVTQAGTGTLVLIASNNTYSGGTNISSGTLQVGNGATAGTIGSGTVTNNSALAFNLTADFTVGNTITGTGSVTQSGSGVLTLSGSNSYGGVTNVNAGTLRVNGSSTGTGAVTVAGGATLGGSGSLNGPVTATGTLAPGNSVGTLVVNNNLTVSGAFQAELGAAAGDQVNLSNGSNALNLGNGSTLALVNSGFDGSTTIYTLADLQGTGASLLQVGGANVAPGSTISVFTSTGGNAGTVSNVQGNVNITLTGFNLTAGETMTLRRTAGGDLVVVFSPVPEPGTVLGVCALAAGGVTVVRRRWKRK